MPHINRISSIRSGFDYQDFWGLRLLGQWLVEPDKYKWIQFETCPDDDNSRQFYLDDIVCFDSNDLYCFYQIKYRQDSTNVWTWDNLLVPERSRGTSIIKKWTQSLLPRMDKTKEAFFITNGQTAEGINKYLKDDRLDIEQIKREDINLYNRIVGEIGSDQQLNRLFQILHFRFNQENLSGDELENNIRNYFYENIKATESGVTNLYHKIRKECRQQQPKQLDIETLRKWCEFDNPRPLDEQFEIPSDFEFFNNQTHQSFLTEIQNPKGGIKIIFGKPGVGKSVYLSRLDDELKKVNIISIKHHYHISPEDTNPQERLNAERVIEAIKSQLKFHKEELGDLANKNSKGIPVREFIKTIATKLNRDNKVFVIIIDGLDHVLRYAGREELENFLKEICVPQPSVWIVIGMQEIAKSHLPQIVFDKCPKDEWIEIKGLSKEAVSKIIYANKVGLHLPDQAEQSKNLVEKLSSITDGNPLHLRYSLQQLKNLPGNNIVTDYSCNNLIPYGDGIEKYYNSLWSQISNNAQTLLLAIASVNFLFTKEQLVEYVSLSTTNPADIANGFNQISHLISKKLREQMSVYHNSFELFLKNLPEMGQQKNVIKMNVRKWLERSNYEYLKWAELRIIEHELGNNNPIFAINRQWLINAICYPCNSSQISNQMQLTVKVALEKGDFAKALQISCLHTYYLNSGKFIEEATKCIWEETLSKNNAVFNYIDFKMLPTEVFPTLAKLADDRGDIISISEIIKILIERLDKQENRKNTIPPVTLALLHVIPYDRRREVDKLYKYIIQFRDLEITDSLFEVYSQKLLMLGQKEKLEKLLKLGLTEKEEKSILAQCVKYGFENSQEDISNYFENKKNTPNQYLLYKYLKNKTVEDLPTLPEYSIFPQTIKEYDSEGRAKWKEFYYDQFLIGLLYGVYGRQADVEKWIDGAPDIWLSKAICRLFEASLKIVSGIQKSKIAYIDLFNSFSTLEELKWPEDRDRLNLQYAFRDALKIIIRDIIPFKKYLGDNCAINLDDYLIIIRKPLFFSKDDFIELVVDTEKPLFTQEVYEKIRDESISNLSHTVNRFPDRALDYANLSKLARLYKDDKNYDVFLKKAADNLLGYGEHKDVYLYYVVEAIDLCDKANLCKEKIDGWVKRIIPLINSVGDYTDGDETSDLPFELAEFLAKQNPSLLYKNYFDTAEREELYDAEGLFKYVIKSLSFEKEEQIALASTAIDNGSFLELKNIAKNNIGAAQALNTIQTYLGKIDFEGQKSQSPEIEEPINDYSKIKPVDLLTYLITNFENKWDWNKYLLGWSDYWLTKVDRKSIYNILLQVIEKFGKQNFYGEFLDILYPLAYEFDNGSAFEILCQVQIEDRWENIWSHIEKSKKRWGFIKDKYPKRYLEFFQKSTNYHIPIPRGVEFLLFFNDLEKAEEITEASIQFVESLMADVVLPLPKWLESSEEIVEIDLLMQRLIWPSPLVRERSATAIANLLCTSDGKENIFKKLLLWIQEQKMESIIAIGLLPIIKAFYISKSHVDLNYINLQTIANFVEIKSVVIEKLFEELAFLRGIPKVELSDYKDVDLCPENYSVNVFFVKHIKTVLAPIYLLNAEEIEKHFGKGFVKQWSFTADYIARDVGITFNSQQLNYYARNEDAEFLHGFSSKISEVYRSAFLRVLYYFYNNGDIPERFYLEYAYTTLPVELSRWKILPNQPPPWWPKIRHSVNEGKKEQLPVTIYFHNSPEELIKIKWDNKLLIAAEGAIRLEDSQLLTNPSHSFSIISFGYKIIGSQMPTPKEVAAKISYAPQLVRNPSKTCKPFHFLEDQSNYLTTENEFVRIKDILIYPIVAREKDLSIGLWQYFRGYNMPLNLNLPLSKDLKLIINNKNWIYQDKEKTCVAIHTDWLDGLQERYNKDMPLPHGQYLIIDESFLNKWLEGNGLRLGYMLKITYGYQKHGYGKVETHEDTKLLNVSNIIVP